MRAFHRRREMRVGEIEAAVADGQLGEPDLGGRTPLHGGRRRTATPSAWRDMSSIARPPSVASAGHRADS
jgi:hypothetical protein